MYRIFCESYDNFKKSFYDENSRSKIVDALEPLVDTSKYKEEQELESDIYKKVCDLISFMEENIDKFPKFKAFLWTLGARNIIGKKYNIVNEEELEEQAKVINSFLKLAYWY